MVLPIWVAVIVQVPPATIVTVVPDTVQMVWVEEANDTVKPDDAVALSVSVPEPYTTFESVPKVIVWGARVVTLIVWLAVAKPDAPGAIDPDSVAVTIIGQFCSGAAVPTVITPPLAVIAKPACVLAGSIEYPILPVPPVACAVASIAADCPAGWAVGVIAGKLRATLTTKL